MIETGTPGRWPRCCGKHLWADVLAQHFETGHWCNRFTMGAIQWWQAWAPLTTVAGRHHSWGSGRCSKNFEKPKGYGGRQHACRILENDLRPRLADCLCNKVWCNGHVPDEWHEAVVSPMCKIKNLASCEGYVLSHYWQSATVSSLQFCCPAWKLQALTQ